MQLSLELYVFYSSMPSVIENATHTDSTVVPTSSSTETRTVAVQLSEPSDPRAAVSAAEIVRPAQEVFLKLLKREPALSLSLAYLFLTAVGITYDWWFYLFFGVNILEYADFTDFLLAAVREPLVMVFTVLSAVIILLFQEMNYRARIRFPAYDRMCRNPWMGLGQSAYFIPVRVYTAFTIIVYFGGVFTPFYAMYRADKIRSGSSRPVAVRLVNEAVASGTSATRESRVVGTTSRFVFLYDVQAKKTSVIPFDSIAEMTIDR